MQHQLEPRFSSSSAGASSLSRTPSYASHNWRHKYTVVTSWGECIEPYLPCFKFQSSMWKCTRSWNGPTSAMCCFMFSSNSKSQQQVLGPTRTTGLGTRVTQDIRLTQNGVICMIAHEHLKCGSGPHTDTGVYGVLSPNCCLLCQYNTHNLHVNVDCCTYSWCSQ